ncbi:MAG: hypothetical protein H8D74_02235 [Chloroflexi bacterium]|nr:hypothetical protein [Chloroflexota bacterium]
MAKPRPKRVMFDTNVPIVSALDKRSVERQVLNWLAAQPDITILMSKELSDQILRIGKRIGGKDWAGWIHYTVWHDYTIEFVEIPEAVKELVEQTTDIPREDITIFLTALLGRADCFISVNRELVKEAAAIQNAFECLTPEEFHRKYIA